MKKRRNIAAAIVLSSMMAVSTCAFTVTSMTASAGSLYSSDTNASYEAFQLLKGTPGTITDGSASLGNAQWGSALTGGLPSALLTKLKADTTFGTGALNKFNTLKDSENSSPSTPAEFAAVLSTLSTEAEKEQFAKIIGNSLSSGGTAISNNSTSPTSVADGYYVIKGTNSTGTTLNLLKVAGTLAISGKTGVPSSDKKVTDKNDSTGTTETPGTTADYDIGDSVPYTLTFTLPSDYARYETYPITFIDDMCAGLTYNNDATITYGSSEPVDIHTSGNTFASTSDASANNGTVYKFVIADLKTTTPSLTAGSTITINYSATLNGSAVVGGTGNKNTYKVQFANDPNYIPPSGETPNPPTGETPPSENTVYTYKVVINKVEPDGSGTKPLTGAGFTLYKLVAGSGSETVTVGSNNYTGTWTDVTSLGSGSNKPSYTVTDSGTTTACVFTFSGLDDGCYKLVESTVPAGYNKADDKIFEISAVTNGTLDSSSGFTIDSSAGSLTGNVVNNAGATLPSTGGIGTTLFYIIGGTLVAGSIVLLITKKRMHSTEE